MQNRLILCIAALSSACDSTGTSQRVKIDPIPPPVATYKGREIAQTMHYLGAPWLTRESRDREEDCASLAQSIANPAGRDRLRHGLRQRLLFAADRSSSSASTARSSRSTFSGKCWRCSRSRPRPRRVANIETVQGTVIDPKLPPESVDLMLMVDVYHEFSHPEQMLAAIRKSLKPTGRVALVEFRAEDPDVPIKPLHKMSKAQIMKEFPPNGFKLVEEFDKLPWQHLMFFQRDDAAPRRGEGETGSREDADSG